IHWDGARWIRETPDVTGCHGQIHHVWGSAPNDVWFACDDYQNAFLHWSGAGWSRFASPGCRTTGRIRGSGRDRAWAADCDTGDLLAWDGASWSRAAASTVDFVALWAAAPRDVWAVGGGRFARWDGATWRWV